MSRAPNTTGGCIGGHYNYAQLEGLWINAGGKKSLAPLMAAIADAESGGCASALNATDNNGTQTSVGLWQVSTGTHQYPPAWATATGNAQEAVAKYNTQGLTAWGTYTSGAYKAFLSPSSTPDTNVPGASAPASGSACLISLPSLGPIGGGCLFGKSQARAVLGGLMLASGGLVAFAGVAVLVVTAFAGSKPARALAGTAAKTKKLTARAKP